jgi:hypothetical protein
LDYNEYVWPAISLAEIDKNWADSPCMDNYEDMNHRRWSAVLLMAAVFFPPGACGQEGRWAGLMNDLLSDGLDVSSGQRVSVSPPILDPQDTSDDPLAATSRLAGSKEWKQFSRKSVVAPVRIDLDYLRTSDGTRLGQRMHIAFVVHAGIETLRDADVMRRLLRGNSQQSERPEGFHSESINRDVLKAFGVESTEACSYSWLEFVLLKKVELQAVIRSQRTEGDGFFVIAWMLDERFTDHEPPDDDYRNEWVKRDRDELGKTIRGERHSYSGAGGYLVVSGLEGIEGASLIEAEIVFSEPAAWFGGSNLLRSKLPLIVQESVRRFRRELR